MSEIELQEIRTLHNFLRTKLGIERMNPKMLELDRKWAPIDVVAVLLDRVDTLAARVKELETSVEFHKEQFRAKALRNGENCIERDRYKAALTYLHGSGAALLEANECGIECRGDEDCDHCVFMQAMAQAAAILETQTKEG